mmetsp:Transcript_61226/g.145762  ORF Transcript_61226/g.145762 Transcript_61226/m.145762 type:complete len:215 (+) Transcript_61226:845-1489(+)
MALLGVAGLQHEKSGVLEHVLKLDRQPKLLPKPKLLSSSKLPCFDELPLSTKPVEAARFSCLSGVVHNVMLDELPSHLFDWTQGDALRVEDWGVTYSEETVLPRGVRGPRLIALSHVTGILLPDIDALPLDGEGVIQSAPRLGLLVLDPSKTFGLLLDAGVDAPRHHIPLESSSPLPTATLGKEAFSFSIAADKADSAEHNRCLCTSLCGNALP